MNEHSRCMYCGKPCTIVRENIGTAQEKNYVDCKDCGKRELTKLGLSRLKARK